MRFTRISEAINNLDPSILVVCDLPERLRRLRAARDFAGVKIARCVSAKEIGSLDEVYDLVVVDVETEQLAGVLKIVREKAGSEGVPILVEASRLGTAHGLAGVLPRYRAMPCSRDELIILVHFYLAPGGWRNRPARRFL
jgi:hypothetical protein